MKRLFIIILVLAFTGPASAQMFGMKNPLISQEAPEFSTNTVQHKSMTFSQVHAKKPSIMFFWATWCPHCRVQLKELNDMKDELAAKDINVILVDVGETAEQVGAYLKRNNIDFDVFIDGDSSISEQYGLIGVPTFFFIDKEGIVKDVKHALVEDYETILFKK